MYRYYHPSFLHEFVVILLGLLGFVLLIVLAPGILVNYFTDRLPGHPHGHALISASANDWVTWVISLFFWGGCLTLCLKVKRE